MSRSFFRLFAGAILVAAALPIGHALAEHPRWAPMTPESMAKQKAAVVPVSARPANRGRNYRVRSSNSGAGNRRYSYNYSGVGFPGMEGGLTAAANRTTWLKRP
jgi:hypothetical protein